MIGCPLCHALSHRRMTPVLSNANSGAATHVHGSGHAASQDRESAAFVAPRTSGRPIIDFHSHMLEPSLIVPGAAMAATVAQQQTDIAVRLADMDRRGIDYSVVSHNSVMQGISWGDARRDLEIYRRLNDRLAGEFVAAHPDRLMGAFGLPTQDLDLALPELERAVTKLGLRVLQISSCTADGTYYGDPRLDPFWEAVQHFGVTVFIHPHGQLKDAPLHEFLLNIAVGQSIEEVKVMSSLIYHGVFDKFPRVKIMVAHGGGFLLHYPGRIDRNLVPAPFRLQYPSEYFRCFYYDSCVYAPSVMAEVVRIVGADRIVLGSDYPFGPSDPVAQLRATPGLNDTDFDKIVRQTPATLLGVSSVDGFSREP